ncbi:SH3 domain-containing protein [Echinicola salinicaeni]|uniref:SH3 domain-containing protein n=1 Tax=Echinicola salinicaeni TaxID=2762757 RepID=UPI0016486410|nr:SH3 domain-containing protein [Echinicola salinicaeni]
MPNIKQNFIALFLIFPLISIQSINCQADTKSLFLADSLFNAKSYQEAYKQYVDILKNEDAYSPAMLLKMAYITEGMGNHEETTLYLSKYYDLNPNPKVISKIKALTDQTDLKGYEISDKAQFFKILTDYQQEITGAFALLLITGLILSITSNKTKKLQYYIPIVLFLALTFISNNFLKAPETGVIKESPTIIMREPTAAGELLAKVNPGHRVIIKSSTDIWYQIEWEGKDAFVKKSSISRL